MALPTYHCHEFRHIVHSVSAISPRLYYHRSARREFQLCDLVLHTVVGKTSKFNLAHEVGIDV